MKTVFIVAVSDAKPHQKGEFWTDEAFENEADAVESAHVCMRAKGDQSWLNWEEDRIRDGAHVVHQFTHVNGHHRVWVERLIFRPEIQGARDE